MSKIPTRKNTDLYIPFMVISFYRLCINLKFHLQFQYFSWSVSLGPTFKTTAQYFGTDFSNGYHVTTQLWSFPRLPVPSKDTILVKLLSFSSFVLRFIYPVLPSKNIVLLNQ